MQQDIVGAIHHSFEQKFPELRAIRSFAQDAIYFDLPCKRVSNVSHLWVASLRFFNNIITVELVTLKGNGEYAYDTSNQFLLSDPQSMELATDCICNHVHATKNVVNPQEISKHDLLP